MILDGKESTGMPSVTLTSEPVTFKISEVLF